MTDWDDAYANSAHIPGADALPALWARQAAAFRAELDAAANLFTADLPYGPDPRQRFDLIRSPGQTRGLLVLVHGGYWHATGKSDWTHLARGAWSRGWAVALPGYRLAPQVRIADITRDIAAAVIAAAALVPGPLHLAGHSAGGHLVTRLLCDDTPLPEPVTARLARVTSISGLHDLRLLPRTAMNRTLGLGPTEAASESPALRAPISGARLNLWVGTAERPEFRRQARLMALIWDGLAETHLTEEPGRHHFSVLDGLTQPGSPLLDAVLG